MRRKKQNHIFLLAAILSMALSVWLTGFGEQLMALRFFTAPPKPSTTCQRPPNPPLGLKVSNYGNGQVLLTWIDNSNDEYGFEIWRSLDKNIFNDLTGRVPENVANYIDVDAKNMNFWYQVRAWNDCGHSQFTDPVNIIILLPPLGPTHTPTPNITSTVILTPTLTPTPTPTPTPQPPASPTESESAIPYVISSGALGIRTGPGPEYETIRELTAEVKVEIIGRLQDNSWLKIVCAEASIGDGCWVPNDPGFVEVFNIDKAPVIPIENLLTRETVTPTQTATSEPEKTVETVTASTPLITKTPEPGNSICASPLIIGLFAFIGFVGKRTALKQRLKKSENR